MATDERVDPFRAYNFRLEVDNLSSVSFSECSGLSSDGEPVEYREGIDPPYPRKLRAQRKFSNITLKRGYTADTEFWDWYKSILKGDPDYRRNGSIILRNEAGTDVMRWGFRNGWISKIEGPTFNASGNDVAMESVEICIEELELES